MREVLGSTSDVDILVVKLAGGACDIGAIELIHEVNVGTGEVDVTGEYTLVDGSLQGIIGGMR